MLNAFKEVIRDYRTPPAKALNRDLESKLRPQIQYLVDCRPVGINMGNAIKWLKVCCCARDARAGAARRLPRAPHAAPLSPQPCAVRFSLRPSVRPRGAISSLSARTPSRVRAQRTACAHSRAPLPCGCARLLPVPRVT
jgi:hypothetical protein